MSPECLLVPVSALRVLILLGPAPGNSLVPNFTSPGAGALGTETITTHQDSERGITYDEYWTEAKLTENMF